MSDGWSGVPDHSSITIEVRAPGRLLEDFGDGTMTVNDIVEVARLAEFDTNKALY